MFYTWFVTRMVVLQPAQRQRRRFRSPGIDNVLDLVVAPSISVCYGKDIEKSLTATLNVKSGVEPGTNSESEEVTMGANGLFAHHKRLKWKPNKVRPSRCQAVTVLYHQLVSSTYDLQQASLQNGKGGG